MDKPKSKPKQSRRQQDINSTLRNESKIGAKSDVLGSYVGMDIDGDRPEQDADDL